MKLPQTNKQTSVLVSITQVILDFKLSPCSECCVLFPG